MKYKCLVFDHDDTVVNSTATIHYPCFQEYLDKYRPGRKCSLEHYFVQNFHPGFLEMCKEEYAMSDEEFDHEVIYWQEYVKHHIPGVYDGIRDIMLRHKAEGGLICVVSHSMEKNIIRDYEHNELPMPDLIYGWDHPIEHRKPYAWPMEQIMEKLGLQANELLMIDDLKPGFDMAKSCNVDFAAVGWANNIPHIENFMRQHSSFYFKTVNQLKEFLGY